MAIRSEPPTATLWVEGVRMADGQPGELDTTPVVLTDLEVVWGRPDTISATSPGTCSFSVLDVEGGQKFRTTLKIGTNIDVRAEATIYPDPTNGVMTNAGFESSAVGSVPSSKLTNARAVVVSSPVHAGSRSLQISAVDGRKAAKVMIPPAPFSTKLDAWEAIPKTDTGQRWEFGAAVKFGSWLPNLQGCTIRPVAFTRPQAAYGTVLSATVKSNPATTGWQVLRGSGGVPANCWMGLEIEFWPLGQRWDQFGPEHWNQLGATPVWQEMGTLWVDDLAVLAPASGAIRECAVFSGRITDLVARYDLGIGGVVIDVTAQDHTAELANRLVGRGAWPQESVSARFARVISESRQNLTYQIDAAAANVSISKRTAGKGSALDQLQDLAVSTNGVLYSATDLLPKATYLLLQDTDSRPASRKLQMVGGIVVILPDSTFGTLGVKLSACDVLLEPVRMTQTTADDSTRVEMTWLDQATTPPTVTDIEVYDAALEAKLGQRTVRVDTVLANEMEALRVAASILGRIATPGWRITDLTWRAGDVEILDGPALTRVMNMLDGRKRLGLPIQLTDVPTWTPAGTGADVMLFLEGGRYRNTNAAWSLELLTSSADAQGRAGVPWNSLPTTWEWDEFSPGIDWDDLTGVSI